MIKDVSCRSLEAGGSYMLTQPGQRPQAVTVFEDENTTDLWILTRPKGSSEPIRQRVDELADDVCFHRVSDAAQFIDIDLTGSGVVEELLRNACELRKGLESLERMIGENLGCEIGDGSVLADAVMAAVRDGVGSAIELMDLAGTLRR